MLIMEEAILQEAQKDLEIKRPLLRLESPASSDDGTNLLRGSLPSRLSYSSASDDQLQQMREAVCSSEEVVGKARKKQSEQRASSKSRARRVPSSPQKPSLPAEEPASASASSSSKQPVQAPKAEPDLVTIPVAYPDGEKPADDLQALAGGHGSPIVVQKLTANGRAKKAGIRRGAILWSINGSSSFVNLSFTEVQELLEVPGPTQLELRQMPAPSGSNSPRCKEIRIVKNCPEPGLSPRQGAWEPGETLSLAETIVFKPSKAALWISTGDGDKSPNGFASWELRRHFSRSSTLPNPAMYELRRPEAYRLVDNAAQLAWVAAAKSAKIVSFTSLEQPAEPYFFACSPACAPEAHAGTLIVTPGKSGGLQTSPLACNLPDCAVTVVDPASCELV